MVKRALKRILKKIVLCISDVISYNSKMKAMDARNILEECSPKPPGVCYAENAMDLRYDIQIVVPVYNVEKYIQQCLDSVTTQKTHYQVLATIIDDGSTDGTAGTLKAVSGQFGGVLALRLSHRKIEDYPAHAIRGCRS